MTGDELRRRFIDFYKAKGHAEIPSASLIPENDPTTLFTSSGMQPLVPYLSGEPHPLGKRLVNSQICFRSEDINDVGDNRHTTFFEMLGNWSLGDYFKKEQLAWFWEFLTEILKLPKEKLAVTISSGGLGIPRDEESEKTWLSLGLPKDRIFAYPIEQENWWSRFGAPDQMPVGEIGGPDSEVFYDFGRELKLHENSFWKKTSCHPNCDCGRFLEIGNSVFMEYQKNQAGKLVKLPKQNVDFGGGLERILAAKMNEIDIFKTGFFWPLIQAVEKATNKSYQENQTAMRVIVDHLKAAVFMISAGLGPENKGRGYLLRRLLRRAAVKMQQLTGETAAIASLQKISQAAISVYGQLYFPEPKKTSQRVNQVVGEEISRFGKVLDKCLLEIEKQDPVKIDCRAAFHLFQTHGFPFEIIQEILAVKGYQLDKEKFDQEFKRHQELSRTAAKGKFKGGLADYSQAATRFHTATHLLHAGLRKVLGSEARQVGSNITAKRLRFDFTYPEKLTQDQIDQIETFVNEQVKKNLPVKQQTMSLAEAKQKGALSFFGQRYPEKVKVYSIAGVSQEVCAGPHVTSTKEIGNIKIIKEESAGAGKRRIYAV